MKRNMLMEIMPKRLKNKLKVQLFDVLHEETERPIGIGYSVVSKRDADEWWINVHPQEMDELIDMLVKARIEGSKRLHIMKSEEEDEKKEVSNG